MYPNDPHIVALISDAAEPAGRLPQASIDDVAAAADLVLAHARPLGEVLSGCDEAVISAELSPLCTAHSTMRQWRRPTGHGTEG